MQTSLTCRFSFAETTFDFAPLTIHPNNKLSSKGGRLAQHHLQEGPTTMTIRTATLDVPPRLINNREIIRPRVVALVPVDQFETTSPTFQQNALNVAPVKTGGGFFSKLFGGIVHAAKGWLGGLLDKASNMLGPLVQQTRTWAGGFVDKLITLGYSWLAGKLDDWRAKL
jgi:hypothetical protein